MDDEAEAVAEPSLIRQRQDLDSRRFRALFVVVVGVVGIVAQVVGLFGDLDDGFWLALRWVFIGLLVLFIGMGIRQLRKVRVARVAFESEHGTDAGRQQPIR